MNRKRSLFLLVAIVFVVSGCTGTPRSGEGPPPEDIRMELVEWARLAQNAHNFQSWKVVFDPQEEHVMTLYIDDARLLTATDPPARQVTISAGTFLAVLHARAAQLGYEAQFDILPEGEFDVEMIGTTPIAQVTLVARENIRSPWAAAAEPDAISRATVKYRYRPAELSDDLATRLESYSTETVTVTVTVIRESAEVAWLNELSINAFAREMTTEATLTETWESTRTGARERREQPYGLAYTANFPRRTLWLMETGIRMIRQTPEAWGTTGVKLFTNAMDTINSYVMVSSTDNSRRTQIETGLVLQTVWMELHAAGHVALANSQPLQEYPEMREYYTAIHRRYAPSGGTIQMNLAIARPDRGTHAVSPRFAAEALVQQEL